MNPSFCFSPRSFEMRMRAEPSAMYGAPHSHVCNERGEKQKGGWFGFAAFYKQATPMGEWRLDKT